MTPSLYYTVVTQESKGQEWTIEFGSYSKAEAHSEAALLKESREFYKVKIITTAADQASIDAARKALSLSLNLSQPTGASHHDIFR